jgi:hypothetical protein
MAHRSSRHRIRPIAALALEAGTTIGPRCANVHVGREDERLHRQAGYTTASDPLGAMFATPRSTSGRSPYTGSSRKETRPPATNPRHHRPGAEPGPALRTIRLYLVCIMFLKPPPRHTTALLSCEIFQCPSVWISLALTTPPATKKLSILFALALLPCHMCMAMRLARTAAVSPSIEISGVVKKC